MCGIFGEFLFNRSNESLKNYVDRLNTIAHRGPDGFGFEYGIFNQSKYKIIHNKLISDDLVNELPNFNYFFGHRRLSIIDLNDNAFQPLEDASKKYLLK